MKLLSKKDNKFQNNSKTIQIITLIVLFSIAFTCLTFFFMHISTYGNNFDNSIYNSNIYSNKTAMVVVPHEDDEINIAGATIRNYINAGSKVKIVFTTNGDYFNKGNVRIKEAINAMKVLGVDEKDIIFLGYGDQWSTQFKHIYHAPENEIIKSHIGKTETYGIKNKPDFRQQTSGKHSKYTRFNYKQDIKDVIKKYEPDAIYAIDFDVHADHRATSLLLEEALGEILKEIEDYNPEVFKGFAYKTAWLSANDFYKLNSESTVWHVPNNPNNKNPIMIPPYLNWNDRVRIPVPKEMLSYTKRGNLLYHSLKKHESQHGSQNVLRIANSDQVFWRRNTDSLTYNSQIEVSSGEKRYLNDFKLIDAIDITDRYTSFDNFLWKPDKDDSKKCLKINFKHPKDVTSLSLYDNMSLEDNITKGLLTFSDGSNIIIENLKTNGSETQINFPKKKNIDYVHFKIIEYEGETPGLSEIEVFDTVKESTPKFIKLTCDNEQDTFMYKYTITDEKEIPLSLYAYPNNENINLNDCKLTILDGEDILTIENNTLKIKNRIPGKYKIKVEIKSNPEIYDEVEIHIINTFEEISIKLLQCVEYFYDRLVLSLKYRLGIIYS
ncbi:MAG: PIG-L family deacetylase [Clostridium sp.]|nr:PIG-L family deacetylase [Clostridium sp.]MDU7084356.1 PIG-L family deacetylase [Clostridium sp.]